MCGRRVAVLAVLACVAAVAIGVRVWWVNACAYPYPYEEVHHAVGEQVDLAGAFVEAATERTEGYSLRVVDAEVMDVREYVARYAAETDGADGQYDDLDGARVLCLTVELGNDGASDDGALFLGEMRLVSGEGPLSYHYSQRLWGVSNPNIGPWSLYIQVLPDTTTVQHVPYILEDAAGESGARTFSLVVSNAPVRHVIDICIEG
jgi:hypothetical protein